MKGISGELLFLLIFAVVVFGQHLVQWLRKNKEKWQGDAETTGDQPVPDPQADELPFLRTPAPEQLAPQPDPEIPPPASKSRRPAVTAHAPARTRRRYSRESLFGSKQRTQDAMVAAVILGPCRAQAPYDNG